MWAHLLSEGLRQQSCPVESMRPFGLHLARQRGVRGKDLGQVVGRDIGCHQGHEAGGKAELLGNGARLRYSVLARGDASDLIAALRPKDFAKDCHRAPAKEGSRNPRASKSSKQGAGGDRQFRSPDTQQGHFGVIST